MTKIILVKSQYFYIRNVSLCTIVYGPSGIHIFIILLFFRYVVKPPVFAKVTRASSSPDQVDKKAFRGIICFDFSVHIPDMFIVGVEGGLIVQCALSGANTLRGNYIN